MKGRHQRRALPAGRDVPASEIGDNRDARTLDDARRIVELDAEPAIRSMAQCLAVNAYGADLPGGERGSVEGARDCIGVQFGEDVGCGAARASSLSPDCWSASNSSRSIVG